MEQKPDSFVLSLDDGAPYWPTLTAIAESEFTPGVLYVGTDDGQVQVSTDDGHSWGNVTTALTGAPDMMWVNHVFASKTVSGRVYVAANNYRNDDNANYLWRSEDDGITWKVGVTTVVDPNAPGAEHPLASSCIRGAIPPSGYTNVSTTPVFIDTRAN